MKVLYITPPSGRPAAHGEYAESFRRLLSSIPGTAVTCLAPENEKDIYLDSFKKIFALFREVRGRRAVGFFRQFDLIQAELGWFTNREFFYLLLVGLLCPGIKVVATVHDPPHLTSELFKIGFRGGGSRKLRLLERVADKTIGKALETILAKKLTLIFVLTHQGRKILSRRFPLLKGKIKYLPHCTYLPEDKLRRRVHQSEVKVCRILFFGYLAPEKNLATLIRAFKATVEKLQKLPRGREARLRICGGSSPYAPGEKFTTYLASLKKLCRDLSLEEKVDFPGYIPADEVSSIFASASFLVLPYGPKLAGRFSGPLLLAMSEGIPVIAPRLESFQEYIKEGETGLLFTDGDMEELSEKMLHLITDHELCEKLGRAAARIILGQNGWERVEALLKEEYNRLLEK
jgi:glycosyltransferase involved in cell wall biosynthesis